MPEQDTIPPDSTSPVEPVSTPEVTQPEEIPVEPEKIVSPDLSTPSVPVIAEPAAEEEDPEPSEPVPAGRSEPVEPPLETAAENTPGSPPPAPEFWIRERPAIIVAAILILIFGIAGGAYLYPHYFAVPVKEIFPPQTPQITGTAVPVPSAQVTSPPTQVIIPPTGVWVRVIYPQNYQGRLGNPGSLRGISGSGDRFYQMNDENRLIQVQMYKTDNSGDTLAVEIYRNGEVITRRATTSPRGSIELLIDAMTGGPPGMSTPVITQTPDQTVTGSGNQTILLTANETSLVTNQSNTATNNQTASVIRVLYF
jgi:hypothetical protein